MTTKPVLTYDCNPIGSGEGAIPRQGVSVTDLTWNLSIVWAEI